MPLALGIIKNIFYIKIILNIVFILDINENLMFNGVCGPVVGSAEVFLGSAENGKVEGFF